MEHRQLVLLRPPTGDNATKTELPGVRVALLDSLAHEIHPLPCARVLGAPQLACQRPLRDVPSLPVLHRVDISWPLARVCSKGPRNGDSGAAFFCSNRHAKIGCGRTFPIYWNSVIPASSLRVSQLLDWLRAVAAEPSVHAAWQSSGLQISFRSACRWLTKWRGQTTPVRTRLHMLIPPPGKIDKLPDPLMLRHLDVAFPSASCPMEAFQSEFQTAITG